MKDKQAAGILRLEKSNSVKQPGYIIDRAVSILLPDN